jgi:hypothetical protein
MDLSFKGPAGRRDEEPVQPSDSYIPQRPILFTLFIFAMVRVVAVHP